MLTSTTRVRSAKKKPSPEARKQPSQARSQETVAVILEAAARILETKGMRAYNTNAVAGLAGVSIGSLYQYFPNKDALTAALIEEFERGMEEALEAAIAPIAVGSLEQLLRGVIAVMVRQHRHRPALHRLLEMEEQRLFPERMTERDLRGEARLALLLRRHKVRRARQAAADLKVILRALVDADLVRSGPALEDRMLRAARGYLQG